MTTSIKWADKYLSQFADLIETVNRETPQVMPRIINGVGNRAKTQVIRNLTKQTGLKRAVIVRAVGNPATARANGRMSYGMTTRGGFIRLKFLNPRETAQGVVAKPFGRTQLEVGAFMKGGRFPRRVATSKLGGHVWRRTVTRGPQRGNRLHMVRSEVRIPHEMTTGATKEAFLKHAAPLLRERVEAYLVKRFRL